MGISLRDVMDDGVESVQEQSDRNNLPYVPFAVLELVTPQYEVSETDLESSREDWENWVGQHDLPGKRKEYRPESRPGLIAAVVKKAHSGESIRAVGSGHSHSNAPDPPEHYIELNPGSPGSANPDGLNDVLENGPDGRPEKWLDGSVDAEYLKRIEAGVVLRRLNRHILPDRENPEEGYALENMGTFDGQTIAGAVNTSTHGTGVGLSAISDAVRSVEIATVPESVSGDPVVKLYRIEPDDGITDRQAFEDDVGDHEMQLIQDTEIFRSVVVGYGCMGVVYAYTLEVRDYYWLEEKTNLLSWSDLKSELADGNGNVTEASVKQFLNRGNTRHCKLLINTAAWQVPDDRINDHSDHGVGVHEGPDDPLCLVRRHVETPVEERPLWWAQSTPWPPERTDKLLRDALQDIIDVHPLKTNEGKATTLHDNFFHPVNSQPPFVGDFDATTWYVALRRIRDEEDGEYQHPSVPSPPTMSTEMAVPLDAVVDAVEAIGNVVDPDSSGDPKTIRQGDQIPEEKEAEKDTEGLPVFFTVPTGIRFTAASDHYLSPEYDRETAMVELTLPIGTKDGQISGNARAPTLGFDEMRYLVTEPAMTQAEQGLRNELSKKGYEPRPHMGKHNTVDANWLHDNYEYFDASDQRDVDVGWYQAYERFNAFGTFDNDFSVDQLGLDQYTPASPSAKAGDREEAADPPDDPGPDGADTEGDG